MNYVCSTNIANLFWSIVDNLWTFKIRCMQLPLPSLYHNCFVLSVFYKLGVCEVACFSLDIAFLKAVQFSVRHGFTSFHFCRHIREWKKYHSHILWLDTFFHRMYPGLIPGLRFFDSVILWHFLSKEHIGKYKFSLLKNDNRRT